MATYSERPLRGQRAQRAWDVLASRYPNMQPAQLVSELQGTLGWQWSMRFRSVDGKKDFWDTVPVTDIQKLVAGSKKGRRPGLFRRLTVITRS